MATVGYTLINADSTEKQARATAGVFEKPDGKGIYACNITFDNDWSGMVVWDTGEGTPIYASQDFDYRRWTSNIYVGE